MELGARLRAFAALSRQSSFSRAAEELGISQPAVSRHVADLEAQVGTALVIRHPRGAALTPAGEFLANYVARAEALLSQAAGGLGAIRNAETGTLRLAASSTPGTYLLPLALAAFVRARPGIELEIQSLTSARAAELVRSHHVDIGLVGGFAAAFDLDGAPLLEDEIVVIGPPSLGARRLTGRELGEVTWIHREEGSATRAAMEAGWSAAGIAPRRRLVLDTWEAIKLAVARGVGVAGISRLALDQELRTGALAILQVRGWHVVRQLSVIYARDVPLTPPAAWFLQTLVDAASQLTASAAAQKP
jgi:DNA-binding transcriptional LysR family regulator